MISSSSISLTSSRALSYDHFHNVLLLGEGDFSFARAFATFIQYQEEKIQSVVLQQQQQQQQQLLLLEQDHHTADNSSPRSNTNFPNQHQILKHLHWQKQKQQPKKQQKKEKQVQITATEYGDFQNVCSRYFDGNIESLENSMSHLYSLPTIREIIFGLNARLLGTDNIADCPCFRYSPSATATATATVPDHDNDMCVPFWRTKTIMNDAASSHRSTSNDCSSNSSNSSSSSSSRENDCGNHGTPDSYDLIIFNFPHTEKAGRATKLIKALFQQLRKCVDNGRLSQNMILELRLRVEHEIGSKLQKNLRSQYHHDVAAEQSGFECIGCWPSDLSMWQSLGYQHKWTRRNATCKDMEHDCKVWRYRRRQRGVEGGVDAEE